MREKFWKVYKEQTWAGLDWYSEWTTGGRMVFDNDIEPNLIWKKGVSLKFDIKGIWYVVERKSKPLIWHWDDKTWEKEMLSLESCKWVFSGSLNWD